MSLTQRLMEVIQCSPSVTRLNESLFNNQIVNIKGAIGALKSLLLVNFFNRFSTQIVYICGDLEDAETVKEEVELFLGSASVLYFPARIKKKGALHFSSHMAQAARNSTLEALAEHQAKVLIVPSDGLL
ncbi:MAG: hypothetical protein ACE5HX_11290, partial [bacterium]